MVPTWAARSAFNQVSSAPQGPQPETGPFQWFEKSPW